MRLWYHNPETFHNMLVKLVLLLAVGVFNLLVVVIWLSKNNRTPVSILLSLISIFDFLTILAGSTRSTMAYLVGTLHYVKACYVVARELGNYIPHTIYILDDIFGNPKIICLSVSLCGTSNLQIKVHSNPCRCFRLYCYHLEVTTIYDK